MDDPALCVSVCVSVTQRVVQTLLRHEAEVNASDKHCQTVLHIVAANNALNTVHCLLAFVDDINVTDGARRTALHHAAYNGHTQVSHCLSFQLTTAVLCRAQIPLGPVSP